MHRGSPVANSGSKQWLDSSPHLIDDAGRYTGNENDFARGPVRTLEVIAEDYARHWQAGRQRDLKGISFCLVRDRAYETKPCFGIVARGG